MGDGFANRPIRADLHVHTSGSPDCAVEPKQMLRRCRSLGLDVVCITDHDTISTALQLRTAWPEAVVVGEEITTADGELIGLFLSEPIPPGLSAVDTAKRIHEQGGVVYLQHPFDLRRRCLDERAIEQIADSIDVVEIFNPRSSDEANRRAKDLRATLGVAAGAGSDAHHLEHVGRTLVELPSFAGPAEFLDSLGSARVIVRPNRAWLRIQALARRTRR